jgi:hypothetical protein
MDGNGYVLDSLKKQINTACDDFVYDLTGVMCTQSYNRMMAEYIRLRLSSIFGVSIDDPFEEAAENDETAVDGSDDDLKSNAGGMTSEDTKYAHNDYVFYHGDANTEPTYINYNEIMSIYNKIWQEYSSREEFDEELKTYIQNYFGILYDQDQTENEI